MIYFYSDFLFVIEQLNFLIVHWRSHKDCIPRVLFKNMLAMCVHIIMLVSQFKSNFHFIETDIYCQDFSV